MAKHDNRADNADRIKDTIKNTEQHIQETEDLLAVHGNDMDAHDKENIETKNERRENSIHSLKKEVYDESQKH